MSSARATPQITRQCLLERYDFREPMKEMQRHLPRVPLLDPQAFALLSCACYGVLWAVQGAGAAHPVDRAASSSLAALVYSRVDLPTHTFSSASSTCSDSASGSVYTATGVRPSWRQERCTRRAISPRFAINTLPLGAAPARVPACL